MGSPDYASNFSYVARQLDTHRSCLLARKPGLAFTLDHRVDWESL